MCVLGAVLGAMLSQTGVAQCVDHASGKTAVILKNQTDHTLRFGIDDDDKGTVPPRNESVEWEVEPGVHLLVARATINANEVWVWTTNEVPKGQVCTWTIEQPEDETIGRKDKYRSSLTRKITESDRPGLLAPGI